MQTYLYLCVCAGQLIYCPVLEKFYMFGIKSQTYSNASDERLKLKYKVCHHSVITMTHPGVSLSCLKQHNNRGHTRSCQFFQLFYCSGETGHKDSTTQLHVVAEYYRILQFLSTAYVNGQRVEIFTYTLILIMFRVCFLHGIQINMDIHLLVILFLVMCDGAGMTVSPPDKALHKALEPGYVHMPAHD